MFFADSSKVVERLNNVLENATSVTGLYANKNKKEYITMNKTGETTIAEPLKMPMCLVNDAVITCPLKNILKLY